jgi:hypothetical protein
MRPEFIGDEHYSSVTTQVDKKNRSSKGFIILMISLPVVGILIAGNMVVYFYSKYY